MVAQIACVSFWRIRILVSTIPLTNANACKSVDIPPKLIVKVRISAVELNVNGMLENNNEPFVISPRPHRNADITLLLIPGEDITLTNPLNKKVEEITSIKTNEKQTTPPISIIDDIEDVILSEKETFLKEIFVTIFLLSSSLILLYINPLSKEPKTWLINTTIPKALLLNIPIPTEPKINIGPEFEQNDMVLTACVFVSFPSWYISATSFAPTG